jgi:deferrochelatase/peroxidase EfeB
VTMSPADRVSRRALLGAAAAGTAGLVAGRIAGALAIPGPTGMPEPAGRSDPRRTTHDFFGRHQAGVATPAQDHVQLAAFDLVDGIGRDDLIDLLRAWSAAGARLTAGLPVTEAGALAGDPQAPPEDTGETLDLAPSGLTITFGLGPGLFERSGLDPYGIAAARPPELESLPAFDGDALDPASSGGDLCIQACADDPLVVFHAIRNLARLAGDRAVIRWSQAGFARTPGMTSLGTPRNLLGFKDGTSNLRDKEELDTHVWVDATEPPGWLAGGTYLVARRIELLIEDWDLETLASQQTIIGRAKGSGAPLSGGTEFTALDFGTTHGSTDPIDARAHVRLAHASNNGGIRILRRGYNYVNGITQEGRLDAGLLFLSFQRSPSQFIAIQRTLADDRLKKYLRPVGSAIFAVPPGASEGGFVGAALFG